jgi:penicillin-binding protein 2
MIIFDQLKRNDPQLRVVTLVVLGGLGLLLAGLWWVQVVSARDYQTDLENQSFRTVRIPAVRGKIIDRNGAVLAENRPTYNVSLYLEELSKPFRSASAKEIAAARADQSRRVAQAEKSLGRRLTKTERKQFLLSTKQKESLQERARYEVASNVVMQVSQRLQENVSLDPTNFEKHYATRLVLPFPVVQNLDPTNIARFEEQSTSPLGVDLEVQSTRVYPFGTAAAHLLGRLKRDDSSAEGEEASFSYRLPDYRGDVGIEYGYDKELRGMAGAKSVLVNNIGYRQTENVWSPAEPGHNVLLTLDLSVQQAAEQALRNAPVTYTGPVRGAVVVMDVRTGDILAMASSPTLDPNQFIQRLSREEWQRITALHAEKNRATQENYMPGSIFKTVVGLAALDAGLNPDEKYMVAENPREPGHGCIKVGSHIVRDLVSPGAYDFRRAIMKSSNSYFIFNGLKVGPDRIVRLAQRFHFGERTGLNTRQEVAGSFPRLDRLSDGWGDRNTANLCIGQDPVWVTPLQIAVLTSAIANGGTVLWPRLVARIEAADPLSGEPPEVFPAPRARDQILVSKRSLDILRLAMLAETEDPDGTGRRVREHDPLPGLHICGKTGTAQVQDVRNTKTGQTTWFASFAPFEQPRWAVVVMVEDGKSGGESCSPVAGPVYAALMKRDQTATGKKDTLARTEQP